MSIRNAALALSLGILGAACSSTDTNASVGVPVGTTPLEIAVDQGQAFTMIINRVGQSIEALTPEERGEITSAHLEFMLEESKSDYLLASGPLVNPRMAKNLRSMVIVDETEAGQAHARACNDPAAQAGVLEIEAFPFVAHSNMRVFPVMERGMRESRGSDEMLMRPYVIVQAPMSDKFDATIERMGDMIIFSGDCLGGSFEGSTICVLDCRTVEEATELMANSGTMREDFVYHPWVSSASLTHTNRIGADENN